MHFNFAYLVEHVRYDFFCLYVSMRKEKWLFLVDSFPQKTTEENQPITVGSPFGCHGKWFPNFITSAIRHCIPHS